MIPAEFLELIENNFHEEEKQVLVTCLLQDKRVLEALSQLEQSGKKEIDRLKNFGNWKPAYFAFVLKDEEYWKHDLSEIIKNLPQNIEQGSSRQTVSIFQEDETIDLAQAAEISLRLFSLLRTQKWNELEKELFRDFQFSQNAGLIAACFLGLTDSPDEFIAREIAPSKNLEIKKMICYGLFCNPAAIAVQEKNLKIVLADLKNEEKIEMLQFFTEEGRVQLTRSLIKDDLRDASKTIADESRSTLQEEFSDLQELNYSADIHFLAGRETESISEIERLLQKIEILKQDVQKKRQDILSQRNSREKSTDVSQTSIQKYNWKRIPDLYRSIDLKKPAYQDMEVYLQNIEDQVSRNPEDSKVHIQVAELYHSLGDRQRTIHHLKIARILDGKNQDLDKMLFNYFVENRQWKSALRQLDGSNKDQGANSNFTHFYLESKNLLEKGEITIVKQRLEGLPAGISSNDWELLFEIGDLYMDLEEWEKAQKYFEQSISAGNTDYKVWINSYRCLSKTKQKEKAERMLLQAIEIFHERKGFYEQLILAMLDSGEEDRGLSLLEKIDLENGLPEAIEKIVRYLNQKRFKDHAYDLALKAIHHFPLNPDLGMMAAHVLMENGENDQANKHLKLFKKEKGNDCEFIILETISALESNISNFPLGTQRQEIAKLNSVLQEVRKLPADDYWRGLIEAETHYLLDDTNKATAEYKKLILENSLSKNRQDLWRAQVGLARTMMKIGQTETAITLLNEALRIQPENLAIYDLLVDAYRDKNLSEEAVGVAKKARLTCAKDRKFTSWYANQMLKLGKPEEVRTYFSDEAPHYRSSPDFLVERMRFENQYGSENDTKLIINDLISLERTSTKDLYIALKIAQDTNLHDLSLKIIQRLQKVNSNELETKILEACVHWNHGDYANAAYCLDSLQTSGVWNIIRDAIMALAGDKIPAVQNIIQILEKRPEIEKQLSNLPDFVQSILPSVWKDAFSSNSIWLKMALLQMLEAGISETDSGFINSFSEFPPEDVLSSAYLAICTWLRDGTQGTIDWVDILENLNTLMDKKKVRALTGIILNILLEEGNEVAVAGKVNALSAEMLDDPGVLFTEARLLQKNGNFIEAHNIYEQALEKQPDLKSNRVDLDENIISSLINLPKWKADCAFEIGDWEKAIEAYLQCFDFSDCFLALKENTLNRVLRLALKEWSFQKIGVSRNLPNILHRETFVNLSEQIRFLPSDMQCQYKNIHEFLISAVCPDLHRMQESGGFISAICQILCASQMNDHDSIVKIIETNQNEYDLTLIALGLFPEERYRDLIPAFNSALFQNKKNPYLSAGLAKIFIYEKETDLAINALESAIGFLDDEPAWRTQLAKLYKEKGELQKAVAHSEQAVTLDPKNPENRKEYLENLYSFNDYKKVIEVFEKNQEQFEGDTIILRKLVEAYYQTGQYRKALGLIKLIESEPNEDLDLLLIQARIAAQLGSIPKALELIRGAYRINPKSPSVIIELAKIKTLQENADFGLEIIEKALESNIIDDRLILEKASYLEKIRGKKRAIDFLEGFLDKTENPSYLILNRYAQLQMDNGNSEASLHAYEKSLQEDENQPAVHEMIGILSMKKGNWDNAVFHLDKAIKQNPHRMEAYLELTEVFLKRREDHRAEGIIQSALENCNEHYLIYEKASKVYNQLGDSDKAETYLRRAAALNPADDDLREKLGIILANRIFEKR